MPQITPGQAGDAAGPQLYGVKQTENAIPFQERLMRLFAPQEFVAVKNIDDEPIYWQYLPAHAEDIQSTPDGMQTVVTRGQPEMWTIEPGETEVLVGASAYFALDVMYKQVTAKKVLGKLYKQEYSEEGKHIPKNFNFADGGAQDAFIELAYQGKHQPTFNTTPVPEIPAEAPTEQTAVNKAKELTGVSGGSKK